MSAAIVRRGDSAESFLTYDTEVSDSRGGGGIVMPHTCCVPLNLKREILNMLARWTRSLTEEEKSIPPWLV
jgi:hypothetical protein